jgi:hypothetical protein
LFVRQTADMFFLGTNPDLKTRIPPASDQPFPPIRSLAARG